MKEEDIIKLNDILIKNGIVLDSNVKLSLDEEKGAFVADIPAIRKQEVILKDKYLCKKIIIRYGIYSDILRNIVKYLKEAKEFAEENQLEMIDSLIKYYE